MCKVFSYAINKSYMNLLHMNISYSNSQWSQRHYVKAQSKIICMMSNYMMTCESDFTQAWEFRRMEIWHLYIHVQKQSW